MKYIKLIIPLEGGLPDGVEDTGWVAGKDFNWNVKHVYRVDEKKYFINKDYFQILSKEEIEKIESNYKKGLKK